MGSLGKTQDSGSEVRGTTVCCTLTHDQRTLNKTYFVLFTAVLCVHTEFSQTLKKRGEW